MTGGGGPRGPVPVAITLATVGLLPVFLTGALAVQIARGLHFTTLGLGLAVAAFFATAACSSVVFGRAVEHLGATRAMRALSGCGAVLATAMATLTRSFGALVVLLALYGLINGAMQPAVNLFLADRVGRRRQGLAFGIKQAAIPLSTLVSGLAVPAVALTVGWRVAFAGAAALGVVGMLLVPREGRSGGARGAATDRGRGRNPPIATRALVVLSLAMGLGSGAANGLGAFLVLAAVATGFPPAIAGLLAAAGSVAGLASRVVTGALADHREGRHLPVVAAMLAVGALGYLGLALGDRALFLPAALLAYGAGWGWNGLFTFAVVRTHPSAAARATGITQTGAYVGGVAGPLCMGFLVDHASFAAAWTACAGVALAAAGTMLLGRGLLRRWLRAHDPLTTAAATGR